MRRREERLCRQVDQREQTERLVGSIARFPSAQFIVRVGVKLLKSLEPLRRQPGSASIPELADGEEFIAEISEGPWQRTSRIARSISSCLKEVSSLARKAHRLGGPEAIAAQGLADIIGEGLPHAIASGHAV